MAPEIGSGKYNKPIDVYAIGVILYEMLTGRVPFEGETVNEVLMKHLTARPDVSMLAEPYRTIVAKALAKDPNQRPSRVYDLLPPEDAPRTPEVRIIGDGKAVRAGAGPGSGARPAERTTSCGSRPRSRSSTSAPRPGRPGTQPEGSGTAAPGQLGSARSGPAAHRGDVRPAVPRSSNRHERARSAANGLAAARACAASTVAPTPPRRPGSPAAARAATVAQRPGPLRRAGHARCSGPPRSWHC